MTDAMTVCTKNETMQNNAYYTIVCTADIMTIMR